MKNFMMIFISGGYEALGLSPEEMQGRMGQWFTWNTKMQEQGILRGGDALHGHGRSITGPDRTVKDGPFLEGKELIGGYYIVEAESYDAVQEIAQGYPDYDIGGTVEIREVMVFDQ